MSQGEGGGRPTKYRVKYCKQAKALARLGATEFELAQFFEISESTLRLWMLQHPKFSGAIKSARGPADRRIERSLYHRASGYSYEAEELFPYDYIEKRPGATPDDPMVTIHEKRVLRVPVIKHVPPDPTSIIFWLKNRRKDLWRDFKATEISTPPGRPLAMTYSPSGPQLLHDYYAKIEQAAIAAPPDPAIARFVGSAGRDGDEPEDGESFSPR
jgi:hypothetical protein